MDEACRNCPELCDTRTHVVHGYGDVAADFLVIGSEPSEVADRTGVPFAGDEFSALARMLARLGLCDLTSDPATPRLVDVYLTHLTRCRHPDRPPSDDEIDACEPYLDAEIRMINPELLIPVGQRALSLIGAAYTTRSPDSLRIDDVHATPIRGRGFELVPMCDPATASEDERDEWVHAFAEIMASDYRQTKGRRER
ncbi:uracil-DNA glycosylase [Halovivax gelatinilyticus]|uniref:uracil-DNA glycosylase n=1 Tax=Halovivax gelatinilyticus TaxID=2961597 RepID=UPI0020CA756D|nr:uracil-DNA glycosylase [Halovivax gelatinilyticus]